jgi:fluoroquinolone resistance protein
MSAHSLILKHDQWRKGRGGASAGVAGQSDSTAYAGLDLNLITFSASNFSGSSFSATTFWDASWTGCRFANCAFSRCDLQRIVVSGCTFEGCTFTGSQFAGCSFSGCSFVDCTWNELNFDNASWNQVKILACMGSHITAENLRGNQVDFTGSRFENMQLANARIN